MDIKEWVKAARKHAGLTLEQLGALVDRTKANVGHWESGKHKPSYSQIVQISVATGYAMPPSAGLVNVEPGPDARGLLPLISWVQAGDWNGASDPLHPGEAERWLECPAAHSDRSYALRVRGDSMTAPHGNTRSYPEGSIIFVDPARKSPVNGQRIIAKLDGSDEVTFKVFKQEDGRIWLQPLNPMHPPIFDQFKVLGTVIGKWEDE
jgi:SOS-response transcriptional repressor LexA